MCVCVYLYTSSIIVTKYMLLLLLSTAISSITLVSRDNGHT